MTRNPLRRALRAPKVIARRLKARWTRHRWRDQQRRNRGVCSIHIETDIGFFAQLSWVLHICAFCDAHDLVPHVTISNPSFTDDAMGQDCLAYYFEPLAHAFVDGHVVATTRIGHVNDLGLPAELGASPIERAAVLARRYLHIRQPIVDAVDQFCRVHFDGAIVLGVHFRGTDKHNEAPRISYEQCGREITRFLDTHRDVDRIFVSSDESRFIQYVQNEFASLPVCFCDDLRADGEIAVHDVKFAGDRYRKGREALINCLLLSRCQYLIRTASALSGWASVFNPQLPVLMLTHPHPGSLWFPDNQVIALPTTSAGAELPITRSTPPADSLLRSLSRRLAARRHAAH